MSKAAVVRASLSRGLLAVVRPARGDAAFGLFTKAKEGLEVNFFSLSHFSS